MKRLLLLALAALLLGAAPPPAAKGKASPRPRFTWPNPAMLQQVEVPGIVRALGVPMKLRLIKVKRGAGEMVDTFLAAFRESGLYVPPRRHIRRFTRELTLVALDTERLIAYTVVFQPNADGTTSLLLGESNLSKMTTAGGEGLVPVFPGAKGVLRTDQEGAQVVVYSAKAKPEEVQAFYREVLGKGGFHEPEPELQPGVFASRAGDQVQVVSESRGAGRVAVSVIHRGGVAVSEGPPDLK
ncbi:MAG TPA: hypothetical protein VK447_02905 [Myxococcaceae bacterium]|nr:hypothetical protein [Myxococcaceae bacterium]